LPQTTHEDAIRERARRADIYGALYVLSGYQKFDSANEVGVVYPRQKLITGACSASESHADEVEEGIEDAPGLGTHHHGRTHSYFPGAGRLGRS
jgi:hypothetical protein